MARPTIKEEIQQASEIEYQKLIKLLDSLSSAELNESFQFDLEKEKGAHWARDKNIHDVWIRLTQWHKLLLE